VEKHILLYFSPPVPTERGFTSRFFNSPHTYILFCLHFLTHLSLPLLLCTFHFHPHYKSSMLSPHLLLSFLGGSNKLLYVSYLYSGFRGSHILDFNIFFLCHILSGTCLYI